MATKRTAIIIGGGHFGKVYARILANYEMQTSPFDNLFDDIIITKQNKEAAVELAANLNKMNPTSKVNFIGKVVKKGNDLKKLLSSKTISACYITSSTNTHIEYALLCSKYAPTLVEKPLALPDVLIDNTLAQSLLNSEYPLGIELPMVIMRNRNENIFSNLFEKASNISYFWATTGGDMYDLLPHVWPLLPKHEHFKLVENKSKNGISYCKFVLFNGETEKTIEAQFGKGDFTGFKIDDTYYTNIRHKTLNTLYAIDESYIDENKIFSDSSLNESLFRKVGNFALLGNIVNNPVLEHILEIYPSELANPKQVVPISNMQAALDLHTFLHSLYNSTKN